MGKKKKLPKITIELKSEEELNLWKLWSSKYEQTPEQWAKALLESSIPKDFRSKVELAQSSGSDFGQTMAQISYIDSIKQVNPATTLVDTKTNTVIQDDLNHPCLYFSRVLPPNLTYRECLGSCQHESQRWKPCNWHPADASNCRLYMPRKK